MSYSLLGQNDIEVFYYEKQKITEWPWIQYETIESPNFLYSRQKNISKEKSILS